MTSMQSNVLCLSIYITSRRCALLRIDSRKYFFCNVLRQISLSMQTEEEEKLGNDRDLIYF